MTKRNAVIAATYETTWRRENMAADEASLDYSRYRSGIGVRERPPLAVDVEICRSLL